MYQRKIELWGLAKKHKAPEMRAIIRIFRQREAAGQQSVFRIRGRRVDIEEVYKYFKRKGENPDQLDFRDAPISSDITVEEPPRPLNRVVSNARDDPVELSLSLFPNLDQTHLPTPESDILGSFGSSSGSSVRSDSIISTPLVFADNYTSMQMIPNYPMMGLPIDVTTDNQYSRILLHWTQLFFDAVVRPDFWTATPATRGLKPWRHTFSSWARVLDEGHELMQSGQTKASWALRGRALESVPKHIRMPSPLILFRYFEIIHAISGEPAFLATTLRHVLNIADTVQANGRTILPPGHPIRELTRLLLQPAAQPIIAPLANQGIRRSQEILHTRLGASHPRILYVLESRTQTYLDERAFVHAAEEAMKFLDRAEMIRGPDSFEACQARRMLGDCYVGQASFHNAREAYQAAFARHQSLKGRERGIIGVRSKRGLAGVAKALGERKPAEAHLVEAEALALMSFGEDDVHVTLIRRDLDLLRAEMQAIRDNERLLQREIEQIYLHQNDPHDESRGSEDFTGANVAGAGFVAAAANGIGHGAAYDSMGMNGTAYDALSDSSATAPAPAPTAAFYSPPTAPLPSPPEHVYQAVPAHPTTSHETARYSSLPSPPQEALPRPAFNAFPDADVLTVPVDDDQLWSSLASSLDVHTPASSDFGLALDVDHTATSGLSMPIGDFGGLAASGGHAHGHGHGHAPRLMHHSSI